MCGIAGQVTLKRRTLPNPVAELDAMARILEHRGPDGRATWVSQDSSVGFAHLRLAIIDLSPSAAQPMHGHGGTTITYNGEIYNHHELRAEFRSGWEFVTRSDTECILAAYDRYGTDCLSQLRGMFAFALWDERRQRLFCARDRFGIKPFYYAVVDDVLYFASEAKALLPFLPQIRTDESALAEYLTFQYTLGERTLFEGIRELPPGHTLTVEDRTLRVARYWDVHYDVDHDTSAEAFHSLLRGLLEDSVELHGRSDVPVGAYLSGGVDSSLIARLSRANASSARQGFHGRFLDVPGYDESGFASIAAEHGGSKLHTIDITPEHFAAHLGDVIRHLDFPVAGPGSFAQYMVSKLAAEHVKVVLGGQGGDELFGGYARYLIAYFEQCIKAAVDGTYRNGNFVVTIESIVPNLGLLREYQPLMQKFWAEGLFGPMDERYFRLIDRSADIRSEIDWASLDSEGVFESFTRIFNESSNVRKEAYFDRMTHFDFKTLLPALLHVEDRMSMAHGIESRVPFLDHPLVEFAATVPADVKFEGGRMKHLLKRSFASDIPTQILERRDKMGFPVPLAEWFAGGLRDFSRDILHSMAHNDRPYVNGRALLGTSGAEPRYSRKTWGLISLEVWYQQFHDRASEWRRMARRS